jgi:hypothetical protein
MIKKIEHQLLPTEFIVDIWQINYKDIKETASVFNKLYGASSDYYVEELLDGRPTVCEVNACGELKEIRVVCILYDKSISTAIHEAVHISWRRLYTCLH